MEDALVPKLKSGTSLQPQKLKITDNRFVIGENSERVQVQIDVLLDVWTVQSTRKAPFPVLSRSSLSHTPKLLLVPCFLPIALLYTDGQEVMRWWSIRILTAKTIEQYWLTVMFHDSKM